MSFSLCSSQVFEAGDQPLCKALVPLGTTVLVSHLQGSLCFEVDIPQMELCGYFGEAQVEGDY